MRVLVTGHSGLIGSHLCRLLIAAGHEVHGISRTNRNNTQGVIVHRLDLTRQDMTRQVVEAIAPEYVFHLAANAAEGKSVFSPIEITTTGINVFLNVLVPAINAGELKKFNFTSSIAVYGPITTPFREQDLPLPADIYGVNKLAIERMLRIMADVHEFDYSITRPHNVFGPHQNMADPYRNVIMIFMNHLLRNEPYTIYGDGSMTRGYSYVKDVVRVLFIAGMDKKTGLTLNVGSDTPRSLKELSDAIQEVSGTSVEPKHLPSRVHEVHQAVADHTIANELYGYEDTDFTEAIRETWEWAKEQGPQEYEFQKVEIASSKLPDNWKK